MSEDPLKMNGRELKFPVDWEYRIVTETDRIEEVREAVVKCLEANGVFCGVTEGLRSGGGRYRTLRAAVTLRDRDMMNRLGVELGKVDGVKFLL